MGFIIGCRFPYNGGDVVLEIQGFDDEIVRYI